ncbi:glycosyltransferase [Cyclobacterium marinum]|uniref:glycosyltransferase n=1 Tax=Cyclobacterium marinum TaxID=104 RepID=UPI0011EBA6FF|nr:glycosyltransferase [Cyclobacterium marinum]MBI0400165.1 glycosyltransferase [Cyclobacterium marinum]
MIVLNIVDNIEMVNYGIWQAAISTSPNLIDKGFESWLLFPDSPSVPEISSVNLVPLLDLSVSSITEIINKYNFDPLNTIVVTHGCWSYATRWGSEFKKLGFSWVYIPHGMLEPWSLSQKKIKKWLYFNFIEYPKSKSANYVRAVSKPEFKRLKEKYNNVIWIPNGVPAKKAKVKIQNDKIIFLFMARVNKKKGILPLVEAWINMDFDPKKMELWVAGPDDGELKSFLNLIKGYDSIKYKGAVYGEEKQNLLDLANFYLLPSFSEGFPTSVVEAMSNGLIPLISEGCNFPEVFSEKLGFRIEPNSSSIIKGLTWACELSEELKNTLSFNNSDFILNNYSLDAIAEMQVKYYKHMLSAI